MTAARANRGIKRPSAAILYVVALAVLLLAAWHVYRPGLAGDFLFDDFGNLPAIGATGPIDNLAALARYLTSGDADPTGRPLTLASFLLDARDWPANAYSFKVTNLLLHLLNGALLCAVLLRLGIAVGLKPDHARAAALFGAGAWLMHPLFVSTTLYVVQREAMLPATFVLIALLGWTRSREWLESNHPKRAVTGMTASILGCTLLATLCKANGVLLPLLLLLVEWIVLSPYRPIRADAVKPLYRRMLVLLLIVPSLLLALGLLGALPVAIHAAPEVRNWSVGQRLLTEPRVLLDYLGLLWVPRAHSLGLFTDGFVVSRGWLHPPTTGPCMLGIFVLIAAGLALRKKYPAVALALLFYFAGQLLESTWIPLELYYEHRNYLPAMLMFWPVGIVLTARSSLRWVGPSMALAILVMLGMLTHERATSWGNGYTQAQKWAAFNPGSARAQASAAQYDLAHGRPHLAAARLLNALPSHPDDLQIPVNLVGAECRLGDLRPETLHSVDHSLMTSRVGGELMFKWFDTALDMATRKECRGLDFAALQAMLDAMRSNPHWRSIPGRQQDIEHLQGLLYLAQHRPDQALSAFDRALILDPQPDAALEQAATLGAEGYPLQGLAHLNFWRTLPPSKPAPFGMPRIHAWILERQHYWECEALRLRKTLQTDAMSPVKHARRHAKTQAIGR